MNRDEIDKRINKDNTWLKPRNGNTWVVLTIAVCVIIVILYKMLAVIISNI